jgi:hypothetical protein
LSTRSRSSFTKRQKEHARQEKQRAKAQRRFERKRESQASAQGAEYREPSPLAELPTAPSQPESIEICPEGSHNPEITKEQS